MPQVGEHEKWVFKMFGSEQEFAQSRATLAYLYRTLGEFRFPIRLRGYWLARSLAPGFAPRTILDAGSGRGHTAFYLSRRFPLARITGIDINSKAIEHCQQIAERSQQDNAQFLVRDVAEPERDNTKRYDLITCFEVLEHVIEFEAVLINFARQLAVSGCLIIHTPAAGRFQSSTFGLRRLMPARTATTLERGQSHVRTGFLLSELAKTVERHGLRVDHAQFTFGPPAMLAHTLYELTRSHTIMTAATFPFLMLAAWLDAQRLPSEGGGILLRAYNNNTECDS